MKKINRAKLRGKPLDNDCSDENWVEKCSTCQHCYKRQNDDDTLYCRKRNGKCEYKRFIGRKAVYKQQ